MNTQKIKSSVLIVIFIISSSGYAFQEIQSTEPIISIDMEGGSITGAFQLVGRDSIQEEGINGKAKYFSNSSLKIDQGNLLFPIWEKQDFSVEVWVQTKAENKDFQVIASNKDWNSGDVKDFTTNSAFGFSRTSGSNKGWAIICQPDGSWAWNIGNGKYRLDYRPTAPRQKINDGEWHQIVFTINKESKEARMYFDGRNVAIYNLGGLDDFNSNLPVGLGSDALADKIASSFEGALDEFKIYDKTLSASIIAEKYKAFVPAAKFPDLAEQPRKELNLMSWNIWHGGRRHGREIGPKQVIDLIKDTNTDIVMMQETYGSGALIADALGYYFYLASTNISVMSKYPIAETKAPYDSFRLGYTTIQLSKKQKINLASLWIHYLPAWRNDSHDPQATAEKLILGEGKTRHKEIKDIIALLQPEIQNADDIPLIIGGDFNSPSHKDWNTETKDWHKGLTVEWPVSKEMQEAGFKDSFRDIRPDLNYESATMTKERLTYRIDYIYYKGKKLKAVDSDMHNKYKGIWPSDHPAITTTLQLK